MKVIVIADDMTGAAEVAGAALNLGLAAEVHVGELYPTDAEVIVVDADSRSRCPREAAEIVNRLVTQATQRPTDLILKKVDSLLRGPVLAELSAMKTAMRVEKCIMVCGNPRKRRTVVQGHLLIDGIPLHATPFANDPEHPSLTSCAEELLRNGVQNAMCDCDDYSQVRVQVVDPQEFVKHGICVGNVSNSSDLESHVSQWWPQRSDILAAGGAEFIETVLKRFILSASPTLHNDRRFDTLLSCDDIFLISGTRAPHISDWPIVDIEYPLPVSHCAGEVCRMLSSKGRAAIRASDIHNDSPKSRIDRLTEIAGVVLANCRPGQVWIEGGRTASTILRDLGYQRLRAVLNVEDGIVALRSYDEASPLYVVKPGSYPWSILSGSKWANQTPAVVRGSL